MDGSCSSCGDMTISELRNRLHYVKHVPLPRSGVRSGTRGGTVSGRVRDDLRIMVRASSSGVRRHSSTPPVSFGAPPDDQMSIAASKGELSLSGDDESVALPPSGVVASVP